MLQRHFFPTLEIPLPGSRHIPGLRRRDETSEHGLLGVAARYLLDCRQNARHPRRMPGCRLCEDILHVDAEVNCMSGDRTKRKGHQTRSPLGKSGTWTQRLHTKAWEVNPHDCRAL